MLKSSQTLLVSLNSSRKAAYPTFFADFDGAVYRVTNSRDKPFTVSIKLKFFRDLEQHGTAEVRSCGTGKRLIFKFFFSSLRRFCAVNMEIY